MGAQSPQETAIRLRELLGALNRAIGAELEAVRAHHVDALERALAAKSEALDALEAMIAAQRAAGRSLLDAVPEVERAEVRELAMACGLANRVNGGAIELSRSLVTRMLDTMHGSSPSAATYDAGGRLKRRDGARRVGLA